MSNRAQTMPAPTGTAWQDDEGNSFAVVSAPAGTLMSLVREAALDALIATLERPADAVLVSTDETADPNTYRATYQGVMI